jgi:hypothetical protein
MLTQQLPEHVRLPVRGISRWLSNEAYFGTTDIHRSTLRQLYGQMTTAFAPEYNPGPQQVTFQAISSGALAPNQPYFCTVGGEFLDLQNSTKSTRCCSAR